MKNLHHRFLDRSARQFAVAFCRLEERFKRFAILLLCSQRPAQFERPAQAHAAMAAFLRRAPLHGKRFRAGGQRAGHRRAASGRG